MISVIADPDMLVHTTRIRLKKRGRDPVGASYGAANPSRGAISP